MHVSNLRLYQFRNFTDEKINFSPNVNFIVGANGQGKTNLVEAFNVLSLGRSFRTSSLRDLVQWGHKEASIFARVEQDHEDLELGIAIQGGERLAYVNGNQAKSLSEYVGRLLCVSFSPDDLELVKGGPGERRRFIDRHLFDLKPNLMADMLQYQRALKNKNVLLKSGEQSHERYLPWNQILAETGTKIVRERIVLVQALEEAAREIYSSFAPQDGELGLKCINTLSLDNLDQETVFKFLTENLSKEINRQRTTFGPHRDDIEISIAGHEARSFASQGQTRSVVLALKLAVINILEEKRKESPIVLLDDVDSELDRKRGEAFLSLVLSQKRQILVTGTEVRSGLLGSFEVIEILSGKTRLSSR